MQYANEYCCSNQDKESDNVFSTTLNKKVGHYIQRLRERNSSLQERLNGSFEDRPSNLVLQKASPMPMFNITQIQRKDLSCCYPNIMSPTNNGNNNGNNNDNNNNNDMINGCKTVNEGP